MASFVEQATLVVLDEATGPINKINAALRALRETANSLRNINAGGKNLANAANQATAATQKLAAAQRNAGNAHLATTKDIIRAQRGLLQSERQTTAARMASTQELVRANRGVAKVIQDAERETTRVAKREQQARAAQRAASSPWGQPGGYGPSGPRIPPRPPAPPVPRAEEPGGPGFFGRALRGAAGTALGLTGYATAHEIGKAIVEGTRQADLGETSLRLKQLDRIYKTPGATGGALKLIDLIADQKSGLTGGSFLNRGQRTGLFSEAIGTATSPDIGSTFRGATRLTGALEELIRTGVGLGQSFDSATDKAYAYAKAADAMGRLAYQKAETDEKGVFHPAGSFRTEGVAGRDTGMDNFFEYMQKIQPEIGREMTGPMVQQMAKYLASTKYAITNRGFGAVLLMGEAMGTRAAVGYSQAVKQLGGQQQTKEHLSNLYELGLINAHIEKQGKKGKPKLIVEGPIDNAGLQRDLPKWIQEHITSNDALMEKARQMFRPKGEAYDVSDAADMAELASNLVGNRTAVEALTATLYNSIEIQRKLDTVEKRSGSPEDIREATRDSVVLTTQRLNNQIEGAMGETVKAISPVLLPAMDFMSEKMQDFGKTVRSATSAEDTPARTAARADLLAGTITTGLAGILGAKSFGIINSAFSQMMQPLGMAATLQGATSKDPSVRSLSIAGGMLQSAASSLMQAAMLMNSSAVFSALAGLGPVGKAAATALGIWQVLPDEMKKNMTDTARKWLGGETPEEKAQSDLNVQLNDLTGKRAELQKQLSEGNSALQKRAANDEKLQKLNQGGRGAGEVPKNIAELNKQIEDLNTQIKDLAERGAKPLIGGGSEEDPLIKRGSIGAEESNRRMEAEIKRLEEARIRTEKEHEQSIRDLSKIIPTLPSSFESILFPHGVPLPQPRDPNAPAGRGRYGPYGPGPEHIKPSHPSNVFKPDEVVPVPRPKPTAVPYLRPKEQEETPPGGDKRGTMPFFSPGGTGAGAFDSPMMQMIKQFQETGAAFVTAMATPAETIKSAADSLQTTGASLASSLQSGASALITAGATAGSTIAAGMQSGAAAAGATIGGAIVAAASNIHISVDAKVTGAPAKAPNPGTITT